MSHRKPHDVRSDPIYGSALQDIEQIEVLLGQAKAQPLSYELAGPREGLAKIAWLAERSVATLENAEAIIDEFGAGHHD